MIEIKNLKKVYADRTVLDIPSLKINDAEHIVLTGHNGSGKSTLLKILANIIEPTEGEVKFDGKLFYLPQQSLPFNKSVKKNILYVLTGSKEEKLKICDNVLEKLQLKHLENKNGKTLSGGEAQRLAIARVIAQKGDILLLDEPTSAADTQSAALIRQAIKDYCESTGCILIIATHSKEEAQSINGRNINLCDGKICEE